MTLHNVQCTHADCAQWFRAPESAFGRRVRCPHCRRPMRLPGTVEDRASLKGAESWRIRIEKGPAFVGTDVVLEPERGYTFGKADTCTQQLPGPSVSRRHFSLHWVNGKWVIEDLNSTNGTEVNDLPITKHELRGGEKIQVGVYTLSVHAPGKPLATPQVSPAEVVTPEDEPEPLPVQGDTAAAEQAVKQAEKLLVHAGGYATFHPEHLDEQGRESRRRYTLGMVTRIVVALVLLAGATWLSIWGKNVLFRSDGAGKQGGATDSTADAAGVKLPPELAQALEEREFGRAQALIQTWDSQGACPPAQLAALREQVESRIRSHERALLSEAERAAEERNWAEVDRLLAASEDPLLAPPSNGWRTVRAQRNQAIELARVTELQSKARWREALAALDRASALYPDNPRVPALRAALVAEMGCGLVVKLKTPVPEATVRLGERELGACGQELWKFEPDSALIHVTAPGHFAFRDEVRLKPGELTVVTAELRPLASDTAWALNALQHADAAPALWVAAKHYGETGALDAGSARLIAARAEDAVTSKLKPAALRVCSITLKDTEQLQARVWGEMSGVLSVQVLPSGEARTIPTESVASRADLPTERAVQLMVEHLSKRRGADTSYLDSLEQVAKLYLDLGPNVAVAGRLCAGLVSDCLKPIERGCSGCIGRGQVGCEACNHSGRRTAIVPCDRCKANGQVDCLRCKGSGKIPCDSCGGDGTVKRKERDGRQTVVRKETCPGCNGSGHLPCKKCQGGRTTCPKCKGSREVEATVACPACDKGEVACPACRGAGSKEAMDPEARRAAELAALACVGKDR